MLDEKILPKEIGFEDDVAQNTEIPASIPKLVKVFVHYILKMFEIIPPLQKVIYFYSLADCRTFF